MVGVCLTCLGTDKLFPKWYSTLNSLNISKYSYFGVNYVNRKYAGLNTVNSTQDNVSNEK